MIFTLAFIVGCALAINGQVPCPKEVDHCIHPCHVVQTFGNQGCNQCADGYLRIVNPKHFNKSAGFSFGMQDYKGVMVLVSQSVTEPQYYCTKGPLCPDGWYSQVEEGELLCEGCAPGCVKCKTRNVCDACQDYCVLSQGKCTMCT
ncbi:uncharacterized protein [Haliotis asinina]|uniref:uncharacterized protein n=1 Tax=Haliotis asinina TaxID=109174 RepID=UPI00353241F5